MAAPSLPKLAPDGTFRNPWPMEEPRGFQGLFRWWMDRARNGRPRDPDPGVFERVAPAFRSPRAGEGELTVTWIGHSATLLQVGTRNVLTDPMFGDRASPFSFLGPRRWVPPGLTVGELPPIDVVLLSHNHYDHLDLGSVRGLARRFPEARWVVPTGVAALVRGAGALVEAELGWWDEAEVAGLRVTATPARHFTVRTPWDRNRTLWCGYALAARTGTASADAASAAAPRVFFAGDTGYHPAFAEIAERLGPFEVALLPIGAYEPRWFMAPVHMNPEEAVRAFTELGGGDSVGGAGVMVGIHWGTFKLTDEPMDEPPLRTRAAWSAAGLPTGRLRILRHGETIAI